MNRNPSPQRISLALFFPCMLLMASPGFAQDDEGGEGFSRPGWYVGAAVIGALTNFRDTPGDVENSAGLNARVGYRANSFAALEAELEWVSPFEEQLDGSTRAEYRAYAIGLNGKFYFREASIQPYALVGVSVLIVSESVGGTKRRDSDWGFRGGGGVDFYVSQHVALNIEVTYMWGVGDVWQRDYTSFGAGVTYRF